MAGGFYNSKDSIDISELASLNNDISDDLIDQLQQQLTDKIEKSAENVSSEPAAVQQPVNVNDDSTLFEEVSDSEPENESAKKTDTETNSGETPDTPANVSDEPVDKNENAVEGDKTEQNTSFDDSFAQKYKAKLQKKAQESNLTAEEKSELLKEIDNVSAEKKEDNNETIEKVSQGKITERSLTKNLKNYNDSLDFLDGNVKYSKYVIYIEPQNVDFIEGLTVKERKNLINSILRQQGDILITKKNFRVLRNWFAHALIFILVFLPAVPIVYHAINISLEATINNHKSAQSNWQVLYKEHGKISRY